jgi:hypothetical protein
MLDPEMKSFRLYLKEPVFKPERCIEQVPTSEREQLFEAFRPTADSCRRTQMWLATFVAGFLVCVTLSLALPESTDDWAIGGAFICLLAAFAVILLSPPLRCPACRNNLLARNLGPYCPECGARALNDADDPPHCSAFGRDIRFRNARHFRIRACTHCGVPLDEKGL